MSKLALTAALAATFALPAAASAAPNDWRGYGNAPYGNGGYYSNGSSRLSGVIARVDGGAVTLRNGRTVFLKNDTSIAGGRLFAGERIAVIGTDAGNGNINARRISIVRDAYNDGGYGYGNGYDNGSYDNGGYDNGRHRRNDDDDREDENRGDDRGN